MRQRDSGTSPFSGSSTHRHPYLKARIYAILGEKDKAVEARQKSIQEVKIFWNFSSFFYDIDLSNLKGYPPFEEIIKPKAE